MNQKKTAITNDLTFEKHDYRILVVEDSKVVNNLVYDELGKAGYSCEQAFSFQEARDRLSASDFNLIVLDLHLPDGEGETLIRGFKELDGAKIIILTSDNDKMLRDHLYKLGILEYFVKNEQILHTIAMIDKLIEKNELNRMNTILAVDDSLMVQRLLGAILQPRNYRLYFAKDGSEALSLFEEKQEEIDLVLLDLELPDIHGTEILKKIKNDNKNIMLPVLVVSNTTDPGIISNCFKSGASDFVKKPFITEEFVFKVDMWIDYARKSKKIEQYQSELETRVKEEIEKRRKQEMMLMHQSRLAGMGEMIGNIAHQWRQPLNTLSLVLVDMKNRYIFQTLDDDYMDEATERANILIQKMSSTIDDFSNFFQPDKERKLFGLSDLIKESRQLIEALFKHHKIDVKEELEEGIIIDGYKNELSQVIINILNNAKDALVEGRVASPAITIKSYVKDNDACIRITDNAGGIPQHAMEKIFDPYYTTKEQGKGTGIGLYMSKIIIVKHMKGDISAANTSGGAEFTIRIPLSQTLNEEATPPL